MGGYTLSPLAEADLEGIWLYTRKTWSHEQAETYHASLVAAFEGIAKGTKVGRPVEARAGYLKCAVGAHLIFYRRSGETTEVMRILHQSMDAPTHL